MLGRTTDDLVARFGLVRGLRLALQTRLLKILPRGTLVRCDVPLLATPVYLRARTSDAAVLKEILRDDLGALPIAPDARFIVDAGANVGLMSALLTKRFPSARIVALELDPGNFRLLQRNLRACTNVTAVHAGLWSRATELTIANPEASAWGFRAQEHPGGSHGMRVPAVSVADVLREFDARSLDLLKIDVEGGETEIFGEGAGSEQWLPHVRQIVIELHERLVPGCERVVMERLSGRFNHRSAGDLHLFVRNDLTIPEGT